MAHSHLHYGHRHNHQWVGYDFGENPPKAIKEVRLKQFPNQYCASTPQLQYADSLDGGWTTVVRLDCSAVCPNNATGTEPAMGWTVSPRNGTVAPPAPPSPVAVGGLIDWFSFGQVTVANDTGG